MEKYRGVPITDILKVAGLNPDLTTTMGDPRNALYVFPLDNEADEDQATGMAEMVLGHRLDHDSADDTEMVFEQCLVDARRMILDEAYARLFRGMRE
jgi:hypothetical protein